jgi:hypothetical protein
MSCTNSSARQHHLQLTLLSRETVSYPSFPGQPLVFIDTEELARKLGHPVHLSNIAPHGELDHAERAKRFVQEFINGKWHHHLPNGQNPQVVHRASPPHRKRLPQGSLFVFTPQQCNA